MLSDFYSIYKLSFLYSRGEWARAVLPKVCSADLKWSANLYKHLYFVLRGALKWHLNILSGPHIGKVWEPLGSFRLVETQVPPFLICNKLRELLISGDNNRKSNYQHKEGKMVLLFESRASLLHVS